MGNHTFNPFGKRRLYLGTYGQMYSVGEEEWYLGSTDNMAYENYENNINDIDIDRNKFVYICLGVV